MRIELTKGINNEFYIPLYKSQRIYLRIISIDIDGDKVDKKDYYMMGPRKVHINIPLKESNRVYAKIMDIERGNRLQ